MKSIISLLLTLVLVVGLCACGVNSDSKVATDVSGRYYLVSQTGIGSGNTRYVQGNDDSGWIELRPDGTGTVCGYNGEEKPIRWNNGEILADFYGGKTTFSISGKTMTLNDGMDISVLEKE